MSTKTQIVTVCIVLSIATVLAFWQVSRCEFTTLDDIRYVTKNRSIQQGITVDAIAWAFTSYYAGNWDPVTWLSHMVDIELFGLQPRGHHLTNLLLHLLNTLLLFLLLHRMTKSLWQSAFVAALFALHPLHVESVAWVAERKDVLSTFFLMLTMGAYIFYVERQGPARYVIVLLLFALGLMAKPMLVTLPFVFLLLDYWPLRRFIPKRIERVKGSADGKGKSGKRNPKKGVIKAEAPTKDIFTWSLVRPLFLEKLPLLVLALASSVIAYLAQQRVGALELNEVLPLASRIGNAFVAYALYMMKMIWPSRLAVFYPHPESWPPLVVIGTTLLFIAITLSVLWKGRKYPYLPVGWFWYVGTLVPVIGIVQVGSHAMADRYSYIPLIGLFIMCAWGIPELIRKWRYGKEILAMSATVILLILGMVTWIQVGYWQNSMALYDHTLNVTENNSLIHNNRGNEYLALNNYAQALVDYSKAIEINPTNAIAYNNRGNVYLALGNYAQAIEECSKAIEIDPKYAEAYYKRGNGYFALRNYAQAIEEYSKAIEINPEYAEAYSNRGVTEGVLGNLVQAITDFDKAIAIDPSNAASYFNRAYTYDGLGNHAQALVDYSKAIEINPKYAEAVRNRSQGAGSK